MNDIRGWLAELGLQEYADVFAENAVDLRVLPALTEDDLKELGLKLGHRRILQQAISKLSLEHGLETVIPADATAPSTEAQRRQLTVMFCDLVGSTRLSEAMDPEDYRELLSAYQDAVRTAIEPYEGYIARYMGDGLLVYFGFPQAHEDDAERAVWAGLEIAAAVGRLEASGQDATAVRIGIATGPVVVGDIVGEGASEERAVLGETPNLAARLQALAAPGAVVISETTERLVAGRFVLASLGAQPVKGLSRPVNIHRALAVRTQASRFEAAQLGRPAPLIGRHSELAVLEQRWEQACRGEGQVVLLEGEPGIGKSRLVQALREHVGAAAATVQRYQCSPYRSATAFFPVTDSLERAARFLPEDDAETKLDKLENALQSAQFEHGTEIALIAALLSLPIERYEPLDMNAQAQRSATIEVLVEQLSGLCAHGPILILFEDVHWSDPSTLELLDAVIDRIQTLPVLLVITHRPGFISRWSDYGHVTAHSLNRLGRQEACGIVESIAGAKRLPEEVIEQIIDKTDGVPLFVEEMTKTILEAGFLSETEHGYVLTGPVPALAIPATLQDTLLARLDRMSRVKEIAQIGACIGRTFDYELLCEVCTLNEGELHTALEELSEGGLVFRRGVPPKASYTFKHALVQDTAYQSLLRRRRQAYHQKIAEVLETHFPQTMETQPELLAHHLAGANLNERAIGYWLKAGQRAGERSANAEAIAQLTHGLAALNALPDTLERAGLELDFQAALGPAVMVTKGQSAPETERVYARARELCEQVRDSPHHFPVLWGLWYYHLARGELETARERGEDLVKVARDRQERALLVPAHRAIGNTLLWLGDVAPACEYLEEGIRLFDSREHAPLTVKYGQDLSVVCGAWASWARWALGYPELGLKHANDAMARAEASEHPLSRVYALHALAWLHIWLGDADAAKRFAQVAIDLCKQHDFALYLAWVSVARGGAAVLLEQVDQGLAQMQGGIAAWTATGASVAQPKMLALLAQAYAQIGQADRGLTCIDEAIAYQNESGERFFNAELHRLKGRLLMLADSHQHIESERFLLQAVQIARRQQTKTFELRAATDLACLYLNEHRRQEALDLLAPVYDWFTEGLGTRDLERARAVLTKLA